MRRELSLLAEGLTYGPSYGYIRYLTRSPQPLDPESTWKNITESRGALLEWIRNNYPPAWARNWMIARKAWFDARRGIAAHYDVSNDFYELFLDKKFMFYSCADFPTGQETLEEAQTIKADFICRLIDPQPGEKILELGCGWGSMLKRIYAETGDKENLYGYTLSEDQAAYNEQHNHFNVEFKNFITAEYPESHFDKIYSIGAWEHVRPQEIPQLMAKLYRALKPGGKLVKHFFCRLTDTVPSAGLVSQIFFPGSVNASLRFHMQAFEAPGFRFLHRSIHDYRDTLRAWFDNLVANRERAIELVGVATYNRYLVFFPSAWRYFNDVTGILVRLVMEKPVQARRRTSRGDDERSGVPHGANDSSTWAR